MKTYYIEYDIGNKKYFMEFEAIDDEAAWSHFYGEVGFDPDEVFFTCEDEDE